LGFFFFFGAATSVDVANTSMLTATRTRRMSVDRSYTMMRA
jgi:hypothetical protein